MSRWFIHPSEEAVVWTPSPGDCHTDDYEMAGTRCAFVVTYGTDENGFVLIHHPIFPTLRLRPNNTHATYQMDVPADHWPRLTLTPEGDPLSETLVRVKLNGTAEIETTAADGALSVRRICYPSAESRAAYERMTVENTGSVPLTLGATVLGNEVDQTMGPMGINICEVKTDLGDHLGVLEPGGSFTAWIAVTGRANSPDLWTVQQIMGEDTVRARIERAKSV